MSHLRLDQYLSCMCLALALILMPIRSNAPALTTSEPSLSLQLDAAPIPIFSYPVDDTAAFTATLSASALYVMDVPSGSILLAKQADVPLYPASTTKLMTALVAADIYAMDRVLTFDEASQTEGTSIGLTPGESMTVQDLLQGLLVQSGNDAAMVLAHNHPQGFEGFVAEMNRKAQALHLDQTTFTNPSGLDDSRHQASARDLAILSLELIQHPVLTQIVRTKTSLVTDVTLQQRHPLVNTNAMLSNQPEFVGVKTGTTPLAGEVLITRYKSLDRDLIAVMMGSTDRYGETRKVYDWLFSHYVWLTPESATLEIAKHQ